MRASDAEQNGTSDSKGVFARIKDKALKTKSGLQDGIKVKLVKVSRTEREKRWSCIVPRKDADDKIINFSRDTTIILDPTIENQTLEVYSKPNANKLADIRNLVGSINVGIDNKAITGHDIKTEVLAVSKEAITAGEYTLQAGISWTPKTNADGLIARQRELALMGLATDVREGPIRVANKLKAGAKEVVTAAQKGARAALKAAAGLAGSIKRLGARIAGPIGEMSKSVAVFAKLVFTGGDTNLQKAFTKENIALISKFETELTKNLTALEKLIENLPANPNDPMLHRLSQQQHENFSKLTGDALKSIIDLMDSLKRPLELAAVYPSTILALDFAIDTIKNSLNNEVYSSFLLYQTKGLPEVVKKAQAALTILANNFQTEHAAKPKE